MKNRRRQYITDKNYQGRMIIRIIAICFVCLLLNLSLFNYLAHQRIESLRWKTHLSAETTGEIIKPYLPSAAFSMALAASALFFYLRYALNKTSGPMYRLRADIEKVAAGNLSSDIYLRRGDDFKETVNDCNRIISSLRDRFLFLKERFSQAEKTIEKMEYIIEKPDIAFKECESLIENIDSLRKALSRNR